LVWLCFYTIEVRLKNICTKNCTESFFRIPDVTNARKSSCCPLFDVPTPPKPSCRLTLDVPTPPKPSCRLTLDVPTPPKPSCRLTLDVPIPPTLLSCRILEILNAPKSVSRVSI
jgi:hypothetical protein